MALFQKIFSPRRPSRHISNDRNARRHDQIQKNVPPKLDKSKIRLVISADSDRSRTPIFDSNAIRPAEESDKNVHRSAPKTVKGTQLSSAMKRESPLPHQKSAPKYHFHRLESDVKVMEEMMFGTAAMAFKGSTLKVHLLRSPPQLMVSKVFIPEKPRGENIGDGESDSSSLPGSSADFSSGEFSLPVRKTNKEKYVKSIPVDVPVNELMSDYSTDDDSGLASFTSSGSLRTSFPSPSNSSISSYSSLHRRWMRAQTTSLNGHHKHMQESSLSSETSVTRPRRNKLAMGIIFGSHDEKNEESNSFFQSFFFSHFALIEGHVEKLRSVIEKSYFNIRHFVPAVMEALENFRSAVYDLYMAPRLPEPVWLTMMSTTTYKTKLCEKFMETFIGLIAKFDNKNCNFFVSTLLSAVLTQHLAWVATVTPARGTPSRTYLDKHTAKWIDTLAKTHPYNPLWAQLGDLFGAIGLPRKISRTVVVGKKADIVKRFLYVLSYFIRCSEVHENSDPQCLSNIVNDPHLEISLSPTPSEKTLTCSDASPTPGGHPVVFTRQISSSKPSLKAKVEDSLTHLKKIHSESDVGQDFTLAEKGESGLRSVNFENCTLPTKLKEINVVCNRNSKILSDSFSDCKSDSSDFVHYAFGAHNFSSNGEGSQSQIHLSQREALALPIKPGRNDGSAGEMCKSDLSRETLVKAISSTSPANECTGMSELHMYTPNSMPVPHFIPSRGNESPARQSDSFTSDSMDYFVMPAQPVLRSQSFSEGKLKSRLSQQLESTTLEPSTESSGLEAAEFKKKIIEGSTLLEHGDTCSENVVDATKENGKVMVSPTGSTSSWLTGDGKKESDSVAVPHISRQLSHDSKSHVTRPTSLSKHRSITPTELGRRRHLSSTGSIDYEAFDPLIHCKEIKVPYVMTESGQWHIKAFDRNFGRSLLAGYTDHYMSDFVLHGTSDTNYKPRLLSDLQTAVKHSILDEPIDEAVCVIADTDNWTVEVASSKVMAISPSGCTSWTSSQLVADLIESVVEISRLKMSAEFCLMHLEDRLQEIYFKSLMLSEYLRGASTYNQRELTSMFGFETSDMPLLRSIAGTHTHPDE